MQSKHKSNQAEVAADKSVHRHEDHVVWLPTEPCKWLECQKLGAETQQVWPRGNANDNSDDAICWADQSQQQRKVDRDKDHLRMH